MPKPKTRVISKDNNKPLSKHFSSKEAICNCKSPRCFFTIISQKTIDCLEATRCAVFANKPLRVSSWYRCQSHNENVGGVNESRHCTGKACDIPHNPSMDWDEQNYRLTQIWDVTIPYKEKGFFHVHNINY